MAKARAKGAGEGRPRGRKGERAGDAQQETVLSFRVDRHLAEALNQLPDRSNFIRRAILRAFYRVCPACQGRGVLPESAAKPLEDLLARDLAARCTCCGAAYPASEAPRRGGFLCKECADHHEHHEDEAHQH